MVIATSFPTNVSHWVKWGRLVQTRHICRPRSQMERCSHYDRIKNGQRLYQITYMLSWQFSCDSLQSADHRIPDAWPPIVIHHRLRTQFNILYRTVNISFPKYVFLFLYIYVQTTITISPMLFWNNDLEWKKNKHNPSPIPTLYPQKKMIKKNK